MGKISIRIACGQINSTVGNLNGNAEKIVDFIKRAQEFSADIIAFPELAITGYPPEDLLLKQSFVEDNINTLKFIASQTDEIIAVVGFVDMIKSKIFNAAAVINQKKIKAVYHKILLPNYGVFDEVRYFTPGDTGSVFKTQMQNHGCIFGVSICEDIWHDSGPTNKQAKSGASFIININASPYHMGKIKEREKIATDIAEKNNVYIVYTNLVGGQDELVFDGQSFVVSPAGRIISRAHAFKEQLLITDIEVEARKFRNDVELIMKPKEKKPVPAFFAKHLSVEDEIYHALILGLKDYTEKNGFSKVVVGISGGIDSALVSTIA
ncbi:MAG: nitrilase-related carbon-nitrogen hydrolase, partial [Candidatus Ratteibacteria bacterium]